MKSHLTRRQSLALIGLGLAIPGCSVKAAGGLRIGSTSATTNAVVAEIYAVALERAHVQVERRVGYGDAKAAMSALQQGDIDLFPGHVGADYDGSALAASQRHWYESQYGITWLERSRAREGPCLVNSEISAERFWLVTLVRCARIAPQLRLAATPDFVAPNGGLERLRSSYGGFHFKRVSVYDDGKQYDALNRDDADVANGFSTDAAVTEDKFGVLSDAKQSLPEYSVAPVIRIRSIERQPRIAVVLNNISRALNQYAVQNVNVQCDLGGFSPRFVAEEFVMNQARLSAGSSRAK